MRHTLRCGCILITDQAHVVDIEWCHPHKAEWDAAMDRYVAEIDQDIEDAIFKRPDPPVTETR